MSVHHRRQRWDARTRGFRARLKPQLPLPCISCGKPVHDDPPGHRGPTTWHVGHILDAARGGRPVWGNIGPVHAGCNLRDGGKLGAALTNSAKRDAQRGSAGLRSW